MWLCGGLAVQPDDDLMVTHVTMNDKVNAFDIKERGLDIAELVLNPGFDVQSETTRNLV